MYAQLLSQVQSCFKMLSCRMGRRCMLRTRYLEQTSYMHWDILLSLLRWRVRFEPSFCRRITRRTSRSISADLQVVRLCSMGARHSAMKRSNHLTCAMRLSEMVFENSLTGGEERDNRLSPLCH